MHRHRAYAIFVSPQLFEVICQLSVDPPSPLRPLTNMSCDQCDAIYNYVLLLVVKGNLRHRIEKLGTEKDEAELNDLQIKLRRIAEQQTLQWWVVEKCYERPHWANGAFVYLSPGHAQVIEHAVAVSGKTLQSKHILVNPQFRPLVQEVLEATPEGPSGREVFLMRRAGMIEEVEKVELVSPIAGNIAQDNSAHMHPVASGRQHSANSTESEDFEWEMTSAVQAFLNGPNDLGSDWVIVETGDQLVSLRRQINFQRPATERD